MTDLAPPAALVVPSSPAATPVRRAAERVAAGSWRTVALIFLYSALLGLGTFALNGHYTLNLADEGFLRYGVRAVMTAGQVPMRDFQSYDPGRYYWVAAWSLLLGDGIVSTRLACALFQVLGVGVALLALRRAGARWPLLGTVGLLVTFWMVERFKLFEQCVSLIALYPAVRLIQRPDKRRAFWAGVFVGLAACMGRNHGFYNAVAFGGLLGLLAWKYRQPTLLKLFGPWVGGIGLGYLPMLLTMACVPGFLAAFLETLHVLARAKATNQTLPVPWPWTLDPENGQSTVAFYGSLALGWCFVLLAGGFAVVAAVIARLPGQRWREHAGLVAAGIVGIPYAHYAFSRADTPHLAHSMPLLLVALLGLPALLRRGPDRAKALAAAALGLGLLTFFATFFYNPVVARLAASSQRRSEVTIGHQTLGLTPAMATLIGDLQRFAKTSLAPGENILIAPYFPMLYEVVGRLSPIQEIYLLWPQSAEAERATIRDLERKRVNWALLTFGEMDDLPERSLPATHPLLVKYLQEHFEQVDDVPVPAPYLLLRRTDPLKAVRPTP